MYSLPGLWLLSRQSCFYTQQTSVHRATNICFSRHFNENVDTKAKNKPISHTDFTYPIFAFLLEWPETNILLLGEPTNGTEASRAILLGVQEPYLDLRWMPLEPKGIAISMPSIPPSLLPHHLVWGIGLYGFQ